MKAEREQAGVERSAAPVFISVAARQNERTAKIWEFLRLDETGVKPYFVTAHDVDPQNVDGRTE